MKRRRGLAPQPSIIKILSIADDTVDLEFLIRLLDNIRFIKLEHNKNNSSIKDDCWVRGDDSTVYTHIKYNGKTQHAHRVSYEVFKGIKILNLGCHHCDTRACINPNHIFDGTIKQNHWDSMRKRRSFGISLDLRKRINSAENKLQEAYAHRSPVIIDNRINLRDKLKRIIGE